MLGAEVERDLDRQNAYIYRLEGCQIRLERPSVASKG